MLKFIKKKIRRSNNAKKIKILRILNLSTPMFNFKNHKVIAKCVKVYDGDTVHLCMFVNGMKTPKRFVCRLEGINTPELKSKNQAEKKDAIIARDYLKQQILDKIVFVKCGDFDKYGRLLVKIYKYNISTRIRGKLINDMLLENNMATVYDK